MLLRIHPDPCPNLWEKQEIRLHVTSYPQHHRHFSMTMKSNPAYTDFCFLSDSVCVRESLPLSSLNKGLISASVEYVNPFGGPLALSPCPRDPHCPSLPFQVGKKGDLGSLQLRLGGPGLHPLVDYLWRREEGEGEVYHIILLTIPIPIWQTHWPLQCYSQWSGRASFPLQSGHIFTKLDSSHSHVGSLVQKTLGLFASSMQSSPDYNLMYS